ncbi:hypothetical protein A4X06_0g6143 [Tilletia controversa]|uniref:Uncharacterized protein n=1 Tax=Tilletia controversa TaxID=13291 RepID=A0A8X7MPB8_9BASI|nr:hypothetical protein A4X06_0g6143 [Tilletia controversa]
MFHVQQQAHSPTKHLHSRSAAQLRPTSPRKKQHQHAHRLADGAPGPSHAGPSDDIVPVKPTLRTNLKPTLGKSLDPSAAQALFGGHPKPDAFSAESSKTTTTMTKKKMVTTPTGHGPSKQPPPMTSPRKALGDKTNASPTKNLAELPDLQADFISDEFGALSLEAEASVEPPCLKGILTSAALTEDELEDLCGEINRGDSARALPMDRPDTFADLPPSAQSFQATSRNLQAIFSNHFSGSPDIPILYEAPSLAWTMGIEDLPPAAVEPEKPKLSSRPTTTKTTASTSSRPPHRTATAQTGSVRSHARVTSTSSASASGTAVQSRSNGTTTSAATTGTRRTVVTKTRP